MGAAVTAWPTGLAQNGDLTAEHADTGNAGPCPRNLDPKVGNRGARERSERVSDLAWPVPRPRQNAQTGV